MDFRPSIGIGTDLLASIGLIRASDILVNPGFERDTQAILGWNTYGVISGNVLNETSANLAHSGTNFLKVYQGFSGSVNYSGTYQDNISGPGAVFAADGWAYT